MPGAGHSETSCNNRCTVICAGHLSVVTVAHTDIIAALRRARAALLANQDPTVLLVACAFDDWLSGGGDFAAHLGLAPWWHSSLRIRERDAALRELARRHFPGLCGRKLARALVAAIRDYEAHRWPRDHAARARPDGADGLMYDALCRGPIPGEEMLRKCIR